MGKKLRLSRVEKELTQENVAELLNISVRTYARFEQNKTEMKATLFLRFCQVLNKNPKDFG